MKSKLKVDGDQSDLQSASKSHDHAVVRTQDSIDATSTVDSESSECSQILEDNLRAPADDTQLMDKSTDQVMKEKYFDATDDVQFMDESMVAIDHVQHHLGSNLRAICRTIWQS